MSKQLKDGLTLDTYIGFNSGETHYVVCDKVGVLFDTIFENKIPAKFFKEASE